jgi:hypothetical protein
MATVTCHTQGCGNAEIPIDVPHPRAWDEASEDFTGPPVEPWTIVCGPCGQPIQDVAE